MPVIIPPDEYVHWLDCDVMDATRVAHLFTPYPAELMAALPVSRRVTSPAYDGPDCLEPQEI